MQHEGPYWRWHALLSKSRQPRRSQQDGPRTLTSRLSKTQVKQLKHKNGSNGKRRLPLTRGDCIDGPRPCPMVSCRHNLYLDVAPSGNVRLNFPGLEPEEMLVSCSLDLADEGPLTLAQLAQTLNLTRERARQVQDLALGRLEGLLAEVGIDEPGGDAEVMSSWEMSIWG